MFFFWLFALALGAKMPAKWTDETRISQPTVRTTEEYHTDIITIRRSLDNAIEAEERTPSLLVVRRAEQRLALAEQLLRRRAPRVVFRKRNRVDRHAPTCAVQADLDA